MLLEVPELGPGEDGADDHGELLVAVGLAVEHARVHHLQHGRRVGLRRGRAEKY